MTTITQQLADSLRRAFNESEDVPAGMDRNSKGWWADAYSALAAYDAQQDAHPAMQEAHDALSAALEDPDASNDDVRSAAIDMCDALNEFWSRSHA